MRNNYEKLIEKSKKDGTITYFDSDEDREIIVSMNKISTEIREESNRKQIASEIAASKIWLD